MDKALVIGLRDSGFGLPTSCPSSLSVYVYCVLAGIPFVHVKDDSIFDPGNLSHSRENIHNRFTLYACFSCKNSIW